MAPISDQDFELLSAYIDDELGASQRAALEMRLLTDPQLRTELDSLRQTVQLVRSAPAVKPPRNFTLDPARYRKRVPWWNNGIFLQTVGAFGSAAAVLLIAAGVFFGTAVNQASTVSNPNVAALPTVFGSTAATQAASGSSANTTMKIAPSETQPEAVFPSSTSSPSFTPAFLPTSTSTSLASSTAFPTAMPTATQPHELNSAAADQAGNGANGPNNSGNSSTGSNSAGSSTGGASTSNDSAAQNSQLAAPNTGPQMQPGQSPLPGQSLPPAATITLAVASAPANAASGNPSVQAQGQAQESGSVPPSSPMAKAASVDTASGGAASTYQQASSEPASPVPASAFAEVNTATPMPTMTAVPATMQPTNTAAPRKTEQRNSAVTDTAQNDATKTDGGQTDQLTRVAAVPTADIDKFPYAKDTQFSGAVPFPVLTLVIGLALLVLSGMLFILGWLRRRTR